MEIMHSAKTTITLSELSAWLTTELQKIPDAGGSEITVQYSLREPDAYGCNWSDTVVLRVGEDASSEYLQPYVRQLVDVARKRFNVRADS